MFECGTMQCMDAGDDDSRASFLDESSFIYCFCFLEGKLGRIKLLAGFYFGICADTGSITGLLFLCVCSERSERFLTLK